MRGFYHMLVFMLLAMLTFKVILMQVVIDAAEEKAERAMIIVALLKNERPLEEPVFPQVKRYKVPQVSKEHPWMLEEPLPREFPPPTYRYIGEIHGRD